MVVQLISIGSVLNKGQFITVVNRHKDNAIAADITSTSGSFDGTAEASIINTSDLQQGFEFDKSE